MEELKDFSQGIIPFLERYTENIKMMYQLLNANILTTEEKNKAFYEIKEVDLILKEMLNKIKNIILEMAQDTITQEANREYYNFFKDEPNTNKINFIVLALYYDKLREFYIINLEKLETIKKLLLPKISQQTLFYQQFFDYQMKTCYIKLQKIQKLLKQFEILLHYKKNEKDKRISQQIKYSPGIEYRYSLVFKEDLSEYVQNFFANEEPAKPSKENEKLENLIHTNTQIIKKEIDKSPKNQYINKNILDTSGRFLWNSSMYYYLSYDFNKLSQEEKCFINVFYIDTHLGANPQIVRSQIVRTLMKKEKILSKEEAINQYKKFLNSLFELNQQIILLNFRIPEDDKKLFMYHLGPLVFFNMNKQYLLDLQTGSIHQIVNPEKNLIRKVIPFEFIKKFLFEWWVENILNHLSDEEKNNYSKYQKLILYIQKIVFNIQMEFKKQYPEEEIHYANAKFIDFLKNKIGSMNLLLIQRYLNLFKHIKVS